jgi:hypothetical protein
MPISVPAAALAAATAAAASTNTVMTNAQYNMADMANSQIGMGPGLGPGGPNMSIGPPGGPNLNMGPSNMMGPMGPMGPNMMMGPMNMGQVCCALLKLFIMSALQDYYDGSHGSQYSEYGTDVL